MIQVALLWQLTSLDVAYVLDGREGSISHDCVCLYSEVPLFLANMGNT